MTGRARRLPQAIAVVAAATLCGCAGDSEISATVSHTVRDSAGITIVESTRPAWTPEDAWRIASQADLSIGAVTGNPNQQLNRVGGIAMLSNGGVVIALGGSAPELRWYDSSGRFIQAAGRQGDGPGEFRDLTYVGVTRGDTVLRGIRDSVGSPSSLQAGSSSADISGTPSILDFPASSGSGGRDRWCSGCHRIPSRSPP